MFLNIFLIRSVSPDSQMSWTRRTEQTAIRQKNKKLYQGLVPLIPVCFTFLKAERSQACHPVQHRTVSIYFTFVLKHSTKSPHFHYSWPCCLILILHRWGHCCGMKYFVRRDWNGRFVFVHCFCPLTLMSPECSIHIRPESTIFPKQSSEIFNGWAFGRISIEGERVPF